MTETVAVRLLYRQFKISATELSFRKDGPVDEQSKVNDSRGLHCLLVKAQDITGVVQ